MGTLKKSLEEFFFKVPVGEEIRYIFGTNEWVEYHNKKQILRDLDVSKISEGAFNVMISTLGSDSFGHLPNLYFFGDDDDDLEWSL